MDNNDIIIGVARMANELGTSTVTLKNKMLKYADDCPAYQDPISSFHVFPIQATKEWFSSHSGIPQLDFNLEKDEVSKTQLCALMDVSPRLITHWSINGMPGRKNKFGYNIFHLRAVKQWLLSQTNHRTRKYADLINLEEE
ncbi:hypothetical protein D3C78_17910 [compost metagenome]